MKKELALREARMTDQLWLFYTVFATSEGGFEFVDIWGAAH